MKKLFTAIIFLILLCSCGTGQAAETESNVQAVETTAVQTKSGGVYYPPISENKIEYVFEDRSESDFIVKYLYYNGKMYTSSLIFSHYDKDEAKTFFDGIADRELSEVCGNQNRFYSEDGDKLSRTDDNINGKIYSVKGYDEDFRVCVCYESYHERYVKDNVFENCTQYNIICFDKLNGITLNKGSDLFKDRLHLDECCQVSVWRTNESKYTWWTEPLDFDCSDFIQAMFDGTFIEDDYDTREDFRKRESCMLMFYMEAGHRELVSVYPEGYVSMFSGGNTFIAEVNPEACQEIINRIS